MNVRPYAWLVLALLAAILVAAGCAGGNERFDDSPAGFWAGLWHGIICIVTFIISLFSDSVRMYEVNNSGAWYDFGFLFGALVIMGGSCRQKARHPRPWRPREKDWQVIEARIEEGVRAGVRDWASGETTAPPDWEEIARKLIERVKNDLKQWSHQ